MNLAIPRILNNPIKYLAKGGCSKLHSNGGNPLIYFNPHSTYISSSRYASVHLRNNRIIVVIMTKIKKSF